MDFTEYAMKYSRDAVESRAKLPAQIVVKLDAILNELAEDPKKYPERVIPASREGTSFVYMHPDPMIQITFEVDTQSKIIYFFHFSAPSLQMKHTVFISYSHEDREWLKKIRIYLSALEQEGLIQFWDDSKLKPGEEWRTQLNQMLESSTAGVLLVSQEFLSSKFITETELPKLLDAASTDGKKIFWIPLTPSTVFDTHKDITKYQSLLEDPSTSLAELSTTQQQRMLVEISKKLSAAVTAH